MIDSKTAYVNTAPVQYIDRIDIIDSSGIYIAQFGDRAFISGGRRALQAVEERLSHSIDQAGVSWQKHIFSGECSEENITLIQEMAHSSKSDMIIGIGGGKSIDTAKAAAERLRLPFIAIPTIAATCAATTALTVVYNTDGVYQKSLFLSSNPNLVLVDPKIIADTSMIYLQSGILDSLSKWFEGRAIFRTFNNPDTFAIFSIRWAEMLYRQMREKADLAIDLVKAHKVDDALIHVIDLVVYFTGVIQSIGQQSLYGGIAHPISNGLSVIKEAHNLLHGIKVGYGIVVQLIIEKTDPREISDLISFYREIDMEPTLKGLDLAVLDDTIDKIAEKVSNDPFTEPMPFPVKKELVAGAIKDLEENFDFYSGTP